MGAGAIFFTPFTAHAEFNFFAPSHVVKKSNFSKIKHSRNLEQVGKTGGYERKSSQNVLEIPNPPIFYGSTVIEWKKMDW